MLVRNEMYAGCTQSLHSAQHLYGAQQHNTRVIGEERQLIVLQAETARVVYSWNDNDPTTQDGGDAIRHTTRGAASVNLLGGLINPPPEPSDSETFFVGVNSVSSDTCTIQCNQH